MEFHRVYARNTKKMPLKVMDVNELDAHVQDVYGERGHIEDFRDEMHVYVMRLNSSRRDFVASYQAE